MHAFDVLGDPVRRRILELLAEGERPAGSVTAVIRDEFGITQPAVSQHLKVLREAGFASVRPEGAKRLYAVNSAPLQEVDEWLDRFRRFWTPPLEALATELARGRRERRLHRQTDTEPRRIVIDVVEQINTTHRRVGPAELESGAGRTCVLSRSYDAAVEDVWDACTNPERIPRWFLPVTGELRAGGRFQLEGNAGGTISRCDPPHSFAATWEYAGDISWIELRLSAESAERTRLELHHTVPVDNHWAQFGPGATGVGWDMGLMGLGLHISSGEAVDPQEFMAFMGSDDGREFMTLSARRWAEAHIADGADEATATAMQERTTAFYTGAEAPVTE